MMRRYWLFALSVALLLVIPLAAQATAPIYLVVKGELRSAVPGAAALEPVAACALPGEPYIGAPVISPDGRLLALRLQPTLLMEALARVGGFAGGEYPSDIVICDPESGIVARFGQPEDAALFDPAGRPDSFLLHSTPAWSLDSRTLAWTECGPTCTVITLMTYDMPASQTRPLAVLPQQYGVPVSVPVAWEGPLILVYSIAYDAAAQEDSRMFGFDPASGELALDAALDPSTGADNSFVVTFFWIDIGGAPQIVLLRSSGAWQQIDPASGAQSLLNGTPELVSRGAPDGVAALADARSAQAFNLRWLARSGDTLSPLGDDVRGFIPPSIAPDGSAVLFYDNVTPAIWQDGVVSYLPLPPLSPADPAYAVWGPGQWRAYAGQLAPAEAGFVCFGAPPPRLQVGSQAAVAEDFGSNNLRAEPDPAANLLGVIPAGAVVDVADGPVCASGYAWWQVVYDGQTGWTAEGEGVDYWLEPVP